MIRPGKYFDEATQKWVEGERPAAAFPVRVKVKDCGTCGPKTPEEMREATREKISEKKV